MQTTRKMRAAAKILKLSGPQFYTEFSRRPQELDNTWKPLGAIAAIVLARIPYPRTGEPQPETERGRHV